MTDFDLMQFLNNLLAFVLDGLFSLVDAITSLFPWSCPVKPAIDTMGSLPGIMVSWVNYFIPVSALLDFFVGIVSLAAFYYIFRALNHWLFKMGKDG